MGEVLAGEVLVVIEDGEFNSGHFFVLDVLNNGWIIWCLAKLIESVEDMSVVMAKSIAVGHVTPQLFRSRGTSG